MTDKRHPLAPDVPTFQKAGIKDFAIVNWYGALALDIGTSSPDDLRLNIDVELKRWKDVMVQTNAKLQ